MNPWLILGILILIILVFLNYWLENKFKKPGYRYSKKVYIMTESEQKCFVALTEAIGDKYYIFPQIHLPAFLDHKIVGQNPWGAFRHIDEKSVDFVLCDKQNNLIKLAIELDDRSHERLDRIERDREVERILREAKMPLLRLKDGDISDSAILKEKLTKALEEVL